MPASFAFHITARSFYQEHPTAVEDFVRAALVGYEFAAENIEAAVDHCFDLINATGNNFWLAKDHELARWRVEQAMIENATPEGFNIGQMNPQRLGEEIQFMTDLGVWDDLPDWESMIDTSVVPKLYDDNGELIWISMN